MIMPERRWEHIDKSTWGPGPWLDEPDKAQWIDETTGLDCLAVRNVAMGFWCGYTGVSEDHPAFRKPYDDVDEYITEGVHGGLTFADKCDEHAEEGHGICHIPEPGRSANIWWLGFDCGHAGDLAPGMREYRRLHIYPDYEVYRTLEYVQSECAKLAQQLADMPVSALSEV